MLQEDGASTWLHAWVLHSEDSENISIICRDSMRLAYQTLVHDHLAEGLVCEVVIIRGCLEITPPL